MSKSEETDNGRWDSFTDIFEQDNQLKYGSTQHLVSAFCSKDSKAAVAQILDERKTEVGAFHEMNKQNYFSILLVLLGYSRCGMLNTLSLLVCLSNLQAAAKWKL